MPLRASILAALVLCVLAAGARADGLAGSWRVYSSRIDYAAGGGSVMPPTTRRLVLDADGSWHFGDSRGSWAVTAIAGADWARWHARPYGPDYKIVLTGWNGGLADGPVDADFVWVIYHVDRPQPAMIQLKLGH